MADKKSKDYWVQRELDHADDIKQAVNDELKVTQNLYNQALENITNDINRNYVNYSKSSGMKMEDAMRFVDIADVDRFNNQVKEYVKNRDFSEQANQDLKLYNLKIRVSRLKFMQLQMGLEIDKLNGKVVDSTQDFLNKQALDEYKRQSSILGDSLDYSKAAINSMVNASYSLGGNGSYSFSSNIWNNQERLKNKLNETLNRAILQGKNPNQFIGDFKKIFDVQPSQVGRLLITETARVQGEVQQDSYKQSGIDMYDIVYERRACQTCISIAKAGPYRIDKTEIGTNMYPFHPNCMCSIMPSLSKSSVSNTDKDNAKTVKSSNASTNIAKKQPEKSIKKKKQDNTDKTAPNSNSYDPNSMDSMNKYLKSKYGITNNSNLSTEVMSNITRFIDRFHKTHPNLINYDNFRLNDIDSGYKDGGAMAYVMNDYRNKKGLMSFNEKYNSNNVAIKKEYSESFKIGWHMKGNPLEQTVAHEFGHVVERMLTAKYAEKKGQEYGLVNGQKIDNQFRKDFYKKILKELGIKGNNKMWLLRSDVREQGFTSEYGRSNDAEFFAEHFSHAYNYDGKRDKLNIAFENVVDKLIKEL
ncbi:hypothetical protein GHU05_07120 [Fructobacillus tropaeoli]|uniref:minor capsid protein n=1 Tax=Fructobacillus tropaeoli TaxID=709323 RepID=UPI0014561FFF|nr:minor capsid protein [Fructobacillus tropaeoli]NLS38690.1 hypothetical protein [Fructobacillus tropaeoli]